MRPVAGTGAEVERSVDLLIGDVAMTVNERMDERTATYRALIVLSLMQLFSVIAGDINFPQRINSIKPEVIVWNAIELSPILLLWFVRRIILIAIMAVPIFVIFCGRIYYGALFLDSGYRSPQGDWALWLIQLFGLIPAIILTVWMIFRTARFATGFVSRVITKR
jgi:hypothetical protein